MVRFTRILAAVVVIAALVRVAGAAADTTHVIDFSTHGGGPMASRFYEQDGVVFTRGYFVGYVQGDDALVGPVSGKFSSKAKSVAVRIAPGSQGTATYRLSAYDSGHRTVATTTVTVTQDLGDPAHSGWGYFTLNLPSLPSSATSFGVTSKFVRSSYSHVTFVEFAVSSITFTTKR